MQIQWNADNVSRGMDQAMCAADALAQCLARVSAVRDALVEALPSEDSTLMRKLLDAYDRDVARLRTEADRVDALVQGMRFAIERFEGAEAEITGLVDNLDGMSGTTAAVSVSSQGAQTTPEPIILPNGYGRGRMVMDWVDDIIDDPRRIGEWM